MAVVGRRSDALAAAQEAADLFRELVAVNRDAYLPSLAQSIYSLARRLAAADHNTDALAAAQEAAQLYRELASEEPDLFGDDVAHSEKLIRRIQDSR